MTLRKGESFLRKKLRGNPCIAAVSGAVGVTYSGRGNSFDLENVKSLSRFPFPSIFVFQIDNKTRLESCCPSRKD